MYNIAKLKIKVTKPVLSFVSTPTPVLYVGAGKVKDVASLLEMNNVNRVLVVTDAVLMQLGLLNPMLDSIAERGMEAFVFDSVKPDPTYTIADDCLAMCRKNACQGIIAFGGGSVLDTAKVVNVAYTNGKQPRDLEGMLKVKKIGLPLIAIPTTAGTGSETTIAAVISDPETHHKTTVLDPKIVPNIAILDPELTVGLPVHITAHTAIDALTHAVESYVSAYATDETQKYSKIAIKLIYENIEKVCQEPGDLKGREALLIASFYAGMAFTRTYVGYVHAFAHNIGGEFGVPHGLANAVLLPHIMKSYQSVCQKEFAELAELVGLCNPGDSQSSMSDKFIQSLFNLNHKLNIPERLDNFPKEEINTIRSAAFKECHGTYPVPRYLSPKEAKQILGKIAV